MAAANAHRNSIRRWYQLHFSSWLLFAVAVIVLITVNLPYEYSDVINRGASIAMFGGEAKGIESTRGGWPLRYLVIHTPEHSDFPARSWSTLALAGDLLVGMFVLTAVVGVYEQRRRRRTRRWQLTISDLCLLMFAVCAVFGSWQMMAHHYLTQHEAEFQLGIEGGQVSWQMSLPKIISGPAEPTPWRGRLHAWLVEQLWNHERPRAVYLPKLNAESTAAVLRLREIDTLLVEDPDVTNEDVAALGSLRNLERLHVDSEHLTDACVPSLQRFRQLRFLRIRNARLSDAAIITLAELPKLVSLDVEGTELTDRGLAAVAARRELRDLNIARTLVTQRGLSVLNGHPRLRRLCLASWKMEPERPAVKRVALSDLPLLQTLHLPSKLDLLELSNLPSLVQLPSDWDTTEHPQSPWNLILRDDSFWQFQPATSTFPQPMHQVDAKRLSLRDMPRLTTLKLDCREIESLELDVTSLQSLSTTSRLPHGVRYVFKRVRGTSAGQYPVNDKLCALIGRNRSLRTLALCDAALTTSGWRELASLRDLRSLDLTGSNITDQDLGAFMQATQLESLALAETEVSTEGYGKLPRFPLLRELDIADTQITHLELEDLPNFERLNFDNTPLASLRLKGLPQFSVAAERAFSIESCGPLILEAVDLPALQALTVRHVCVERMVLDKLPALLQLDLTGSSVDDAMLGNLAQLKSLQTLALSDTDITDATLLQLGDLQHLHTVDLENTAVTEQGLAAISPQLPLDKLNLNGTFVADDELTKREAGP